MAEFGHLPAILSTPAFELVALLDPVPGRAAEYSSRFGGRPFTDTGPFYAAGLDAIAVTSWAPAHLQNVLSAARHRVHVLCEKPIAMDDMEGSEMIQAMKASEREFFVAFCYRFSPVAAQIRRWVADGVVGRVRTVRLVYLWGLHGQYMEGPEGQWIESPLYRGRMEEGGPLVDCGVHQIDLARWWLQSEVMEWNAFGSWVGQFDSPDHVWLHLRHSNGATTTVEVSYSYGHNAKEPRSVFTYEVIGDGGVLRYDRDGYVLEARTGQETIQLPGASEKNFPEMYAQFARRLQGESVEMPTAQDGLVATRIAREATNAMIRSHRI